MTCNLLFWAWSPDYDSPAKRKKLGVKFGDITSAFAKTGHHPAIGNAPIEAFQQAIAETFGADEDNRPFVFEQYDQCAVINGPNQVRVDLFPKVYAVGKRFGLNAGEF